MSLKHVVAIVTGAGSGMGRATSTRLVQQGARVVLCDLPTSPGAEVAKELGPNARFAATDVVEEKDVTAALDLAESAFGQSVNVAVNHAGILAHALTVGDDHIPHSFDLFRRVVEVNSFGTLQVSRLAAARMSKLTPNDDGERGVIINTASLAAYEGMIGQIAYSASKGAIVGMTANGSRPWVSRYPSCIDCPWSGMSEGSPKEVMEKVIDTAVFPKRIGEPSEVALLVQSIIENPMLNGTTIRLDGGVRLPKAYW